MTILISILEIIGVMYATLFWKQGKINNLLVQIKALSHKSEESFQNTFADVKSVVHLRYCSHLLNFAYKDWIKDSNNFTEYENVLRRISSFFNKKEFGRYLPKIFRIFIKNSWCNTLKFYSFLHVWIIQYDSHSISQFKF